MEEKERTYLLFVQEPFVRLRPFVQAPFLKKKENVNYIPKGKKNKTKQKKRKRTSLPFCSFRNCSFGFVRSSKFHS